MSSDIYFLPIREAVPFLPPEAIPRFGENDVLDQIGIADFEITDTPQKTAVLLTLAFRDELVLGIPGLDGFGCVFGVNGTGSEIPIEVQVHPQVVFRIENISIALRLGQKLLVPVAWDGATWQALTGADGNVLPFQVTLSNVTIEARPDGEISLQFAGGTPALTIGAFAIGDTGIVVEADQTALVYLSSGSSVPAGRPDEWRGLYIPHAQLHLPALDFPAAPEGLEFTDCFIGSDGFSGQVSAPFAGGAVGTLGGVTFELQHVTLTIVQNTLRASNIQGSLTVPFFDVPIGVEVGLGLDTGFTVALSAVQPAGVNYQNGLLVLEKDGLLSLTLESIRFAHDRGVFAISISGEITPRVPGIDWPTFRIEELFIDSQGNVRVEGGWLDLREQYVLAFYGFQLEISKIGFGATDDGKRWIGFGGGLKLVEGLTAGASVEGMRILWDPKKEILADPSAVSLTLNGVGVELDIPDVLYFKGSVAMTEPEEGVFRFDGEISLDLRSLGFVVEAQLVIGYNATAGYTFFAIYLGAELPAGIPLGQSGLALYGIAGLFALNMEPDRFPPPPQPREEEPWYAIQPGASWYHRNPPGVGVYHLKKWSPRAGSLALGAGVTLGTLPDNGLTFNGRFLLMLVLPGPIIMLEGRSNILKERASLRDEPLFRSLAVIDSRESTFLMGLDAQYRYDESGGLIEIGGGTEAFFDFDKPGAWHLYLGVDEPRDRRIGAKIFQRLFEANGYFMIDQHGVRTGAWVGYDRAWDFDPLHVSLEAWLDGAAQLSFKPPYFKGSLWLHGSITAEVFGFGFNLGADADIRAGVLDPFHLSADLSISLDLPWPFEDVSKTIRLEWKSSPEPPPLPVPLKEVAIEHLKVTTAWPLPASGDTPLLQPTPDSDQDGFWRGVVPPTPGDNFFPADAPVVPLDARPRITFGRTIHDLPGVGGLTSSDVHPESGGWEWIGDPARNEGPARFKTSLLEIALERRTAGGWTTLASRVAGGAGSNPDKLAGSWAPLPQLPAGSPTANTPTPTANTKLWLWSRSPFDFTQRTGGEWEEWFSRQYPDYPCRTIPADRHICCDLSGLKPRAAISSPWSCAKQSEIAIAWRTPPVPQVAEVRLPSGQVVRGLCFAPGSEALVLFEHDIKNAHLCITTEEKEVKLDCAEIDRLIPGSHPNPLGRNGFRLTATNAVNGNLPACEQSVDSTDQGPLPGLTAWASLIIRLPRPAKTVEVQVSTTAGPVEAEALSPAGNVVASVRQQLGQKMLETLRLEAPPAAPEIVEVHLRTAGSEGYLHELCSGSGAAVQVRAMAMDVARRPLGTYRPEAGKIEIDGRGVRAVVLTAEGGGFCLTGVCVEVGLSDPERQGRQAWLRSAVESLAHWEADEEILPPWSQFRLKIVTSIQEQTFAPLPEADTTKTLTQYAYFQTQGPPGLAQLSLPIDHPHKDQVPALAEENPAPAFDSGLDTLTRYVRQTIPSTVPAAGEKPPLPRPVYRAYDVGVQFNENYVEKMYAAAGRDLGLYLFDNNGRPVRDANGRLLIVPNRWGRQASLSLSRSEERWLRHLDATTCAAVIDRSRITRDQDVVTNGQLLAADTLYEARLMPLLLHETFAGYRLGATASAQAPLRGGVTGEWQVVDRGAPGGQWTVRQEGSPPSRYVEQGVATSLDPALRDSAFPGGTFLVFAGRPAVNGILIDPPATWRSYRVSAYVRSTSDNPVGLAVRWSSGVGYLFYLDRALNRSRLVRVSDRDAKVLAEVEGSYQAGLDSHVSCEAMEDRITVFLNGDPVCEVHDATYRTGGFALFASSGPGATFRDVRVDDLRANAPTVYRFKFTSSRFVDFTHHLHSFRGMTFVAELPDLDGVPAAVAAAVDLSGEAARSPAHATEVAAYEVMAAKALGPARQQLTDHLDVTRIEHDGRAIGLLIRTGEPIEWQRTRLRVCQAQQQSVIPEPNNGPRLIAASFASAATPSPLDESVTILLDDATDLSGWCIEWREPPDPGTNPDPQWQPWYLFGPRSTSTAGRRIRIFAGPGSAAPSDVTGEDHRFGLALATGFQLAFPSTGVDLRLMRPGSRPAHIRRFLPNQAYTETAVTMLRSADGTGLILLKPDASASGSQLDPAEYRLYWTYALDISESDPDSSVLSRSGDKSAETAQIDIPWATPQLRQESIP